MKAIKFFSWVSLFFMCISLFIGYAAIADNLSLDGSATVQGKPYEGVYICDASLYSQSGVDLVSYNYIKPTNFSVTANPMSSSGSLTFEITVHNNTNMTYWYIRQDFIKEFESNSLIGANGGITITTQEHPTDRSSTFNSDDWVPPHTYRTFYVTYTFGSAAQGYPVTLVNFLFGIKIDGVHDKFLSVLNDTQNIGSHEYISQVFDQKFKETGKTVIASVGDEKEIFDNLFGSELTVNMNGEELPVTVMVRRENVDGRNTGDSYSGSASAPTGCEYTVYITVDALDSPTGKAIVYAVSYTTGGVGGTEGRWHQLGQLYEGTANKIDYDSTTAGVQGAFDVYSWIATPNRYEVANGITYLVGQQQGDQYDKLKTLEELMSSNDQDIFNDIDNTGILKKVYEVVHNSQNFSKPGYENLRSAFYNAAPFYNVMNNGQEVKVKRNCTRSEIIPYLINIQTALDYFNEVNS